jgi:predicted transcriptional regulator
VSITMAEQTSNQNSDSQFTTPADVRQILKEELEGYFGPMGKDSSQTAGYIPDQQSRRQSIQTDSTGWSVNRELDLVSRVSRVETSIEFLAKQMVEGFARMDQRFEDLIHQMDKRFEQVDKRFEQVDKRFEDLIYNMDKRFEQVDKRFSLVQWTMGIGFTMMVVLMSVYQFLG